jgi:glycosyltransferase involved in cell wall biosynthesis
MVMAETAEPIAAAPAWRGRVALIAKPGGARTGVGRYVETLGRQLERAGAEVVPVAPSVPPLPGAGYRLLRRLGVDARAFLTNYPIWARYPAADLFHLASQNLASLLLFRRPPGPVVVTVHDIIPYLLRGDQRLSSYRGAADRLFDRLAMLGLRRADALIADSRYTMRCLVEQLGIATERIAVVYLGIDHARFRPQPAREDLRARYQLPAGRRYLIYVGSDDPRKNLAALVGALAELRRTWPELELIKVGRPHFAAERARLTELARRLGVAAAIHFLDDVPEADLPALYGLAELCAMPSLYEGFGFPVLEAMACGTPVVCASAASLPELAGATAGAGQPAGWLFEPAGLGDSRGLAEALARLLSDADLRAAARERGLAQAREFQWSGTARGTLDVYRRVAG